MKSMHIIVLIIFSIFTTSILANSCETTDSGNWSDSDIWGFCGGLIPQDNDSVVIKAGHAVLLDQDTSDLESIMVEVNGDFNVATPGFRLNANTSGGDIDLSNANIDLSGFLSIVAKSHNIVLGDVDGNFGLTLFSQLETRLIGTIGGTIALSSLKTNSASTTVFANVNGSAAVATIIVDGDRIFSGPVLLAEYTNIQGDGGVITFDSTLDSETSTDEALAITFASNVDISFNGEVGNINRLERLQIISSASSTSFINTSQILTNRNQRWGTDIVLDSPTNQLLMNVAINGTVKIGSSGANHTVQSFVVNDESLTIETPSVVSIFSTVGENNKALNDFSIDSASTTELHPNNITVTGTQSYTGAINLNSNLVLTADVIDMQGDVTNGGFNLSFNTTDDTGLTVLNGVLSGAGDFIKDGDGDVYFTQTSTITGDFTINRGGFFNDNASESAFPNVSIFNLENTSTSIIINSNAALGSNTTDIFNLANGQTLSGDGACFCALSAQSGSIVTPSGLDTGILFVSKSTDMFTGSILKIDINGTTQSDDYDTLHILGDTNLDSDSSGGATLNLTLGNGFEPNIGDVFIIVELSNVVFTLTGTFNGLPEGSHLVVQDTLFSISYTGGGNSNDVVLTALGSSTLYVDADAIPGGDGQSWATAFDNLQDALVIAVSGMEIWVADGIYYPDVGGVQVEADSFATFTLIDGVSVYGGFNGAEIDINQRDPELNITVLSGDIDGNDINNDGDNIAETVDDIVGDNSFNILIGSNVVDATLDGFTVTAGDAQGGNDNNHGGGLFCTLDSVGPHLNNMTFIANRSLQFGGAMYSCTQDVKQSFFINNTAKRGGAIYTKGGNVETSVFDGNLAVSYGGGIYNRDNFITVENSKFFANTVESASGGAFLSTGNTILDNVLISGNKSGFGAGIYLGNDTSSVLNNVTITGNSATYNGGGIYLQNITSLIMTNSIIWNNKDETGTDTMDSSITLFDGTISPEYTYSLIQGFGTTGIGNLDEDPLFITDTDPTTAPTALGNAHLMYISIATDAGDDSVVTTLYDLDGEDRIQGAAVDMGAYEFTDLIFANGFE